MALRIIIFPRAERVIQSVANFIEERNTPGSSEKWVNEIFQFISSHAHANTSYALCRNEDLAMRQSHASFSRKMDYCF